MVELRDRGEERSCKCLCHTVFVCRFLLGDFGILCLQPLGKRLQHVFGHAFLCVGKLLIKSVVCCSILGHTLFVVPYRLVLITPRKHYCTAEFYIHGNALLLFFRNQQGEKVVCVGCHRIVARWQSGFLLQRRFLCEDYRQHIAEIFLPIKLL